MRIYPQASASLFNMSGSFVASGSISGSLFCQGYSRLVGTFRTDIASETGSGVRIEQSANGGTNWDVISSSCVATASAASGFNITLTGNAVRVFYRNGAAAASAIRANFYVLPI